jgi:DNA polymerase I-like protein with 3'-5' exonuclease and polymerase domains
MRLIFDVETNGLLDDTNTIHCLWIKDADSEDIWDFADQPGHTPIEAGLAILASADLVIGHNIQTFDLPALEKVRHFRPNAPVFDTLVVSRLIWADKGSLIGQDKRNRQHPPRLFGSHSLEAWGHRLKVLKGDYKQKHGFDHWSPEMHEYCGQDVRVNDALFKLIESKHYSQAAIDLEHEFQSVIFGLERSGVSFDRAAAEQLYSKLAQRRLELKDELQRVFPPAVKQMKTKTKLIPFNPGSRLQIAQRLKEKGWKPEVFTPTGQPEISDDTLEGLDFPEAKLLNEYLMIGKRIGQIAEGSNAWLKLERNGRIYGRIITNGCVTGRCSHLSPNMAQVPAVRAPFGKECRSLFRADPGYVLVGVDASGLELRCLAHYLAEFDGGEYAKLVSDPNTDIHKYHQQAMNVETRDIAKTVGYAYIYGAGNIKLGATAGVSAELLDIYKSHAKRWQAATMEMARINEWRREKRLELMPMNEESISFFIRGQDIRTSFEAKIPAMGQLQDKIKDILKTNKNWLPGLDGRRLQVRGSYLNTLLQSAGALIVKKATCLFQALMDVEVKDQFQILLHVHDEWQTQVRPEFAPHAGRQGIYSIKLAGEFFNFRCPLAGEYRVGVTWADTH